MMDKKTLGILDAISQELRVLEVGLSTVANTNNGLNSFNQTLHTFFTAMSLNASCHQFVKPKFIQTPRADMEIVLPKSLQKPSLVQDVKVEVMKPPAPVKVSKSTNRTTKRTTKAKSRSRSQSRDRSKKSILATSLSYLRTKLPPKYDNDFEKKKMNVLLKGMQGKDWMALSAVVKDIKGAGFSVFQTKEYLQTLQRVGVVEKKKMKAGFGFRIKALQMLRKTAR